MSEEKTEEPTPKKLEDARKKGQTSKSQDVNAAAGLLVSTICLAAAASLSGEHLVKVFDIVQERAFLTRDAGEAQALAFDIVKEAVLIVLPWLALSVLVGFAASFAQTGFLVSFEPITPDFDKVNPGSGIKKVFSLRSLIDFLKMVLKAAALGAVLYAIIVGLLPLLIGASLQSPGAIVHVSMVSFIKLFGAATIVFMVLGPLDFGIQKWLFLRDQKMSKDEVKREHKESEGDPQLKQQRKQLAQEIANSAPKARVPGSSVVVTNPTHYAVALLYKPGETLLPVVVAKGQNAEAARIREIATAHRVPIVSNPPLARALYKLPIDDPVPEALFEAVAAVLRWVAMVDKLSGGLTLAAPSTDNDSRG